MPTVNIFYKDLQHESELLSLTNNLKSYVAQELTCGDIKLKSDEVSVRLVKVIGNGMLGSVEVEIKAHAFEERIQKQDEICLKIADYMREQEPSLGDIKVWLVLSELGHSWE